MYDTISPTMTTLLQRAADSGSEHGVRANGYAGVRAPAHLGRQRPGRPFQDFLDRAVLSPGPYVLTLGGGIIDELAGMPAKWTGSSGFAKRNLAGVGSGLLSDAIGHSE